MAEIRRLQGLLDEVQGRLSSMKDELEQDARPDPLLQARLDDAYAQLEIAKRVPTADAWQAIQLANAAVRPLDGRVRPQLEGRPWTGPPMRVTLFASASGPSLRALRAVDEVARRLGEDAVSLEVCDVTRFPDRAERAGVVFTPMIRIEQAGRTPLNIFGALDDPDRLLERLQRAVLAPLLETSEEDDPRAAEGAVGEGPEAGGR